MHSAVFKTNKVYAAMYEIRSNFIRLLRMHQELKLREIKTKKKNVNPTKNISI